ncbi:MAG: 2-hydroxyacyl-CoA dehydratase family protein [Bacillota bacterium]|nr:2-hydroxyacyl-CoA dehydratase family protein [Bacillota bacterium]
MRDLLPAVYYTCSYIPPEVIWAAGCRPVRLLPADAAPGECDAFLPRDFCPYVRAALWDLYRGNTSPAAAVVLTTCCDPMRRLADILRHRLPHLPSLLVDLPREQGRRGEEHFAARLEYIHSRLRTLPGATPPPGGLSEPGRLFAEIRQWLRHAGQAMGAPDLHRLIRRVYASDPREAVASLRALVTPGRVPPQVSGDPRVLVVTSHLVDPRVLDAIEQAGARVVAEDSCLGDRLLTIPPGGDTFEQLAAAYLGRPPCPRMELPEERLAYLGDLARRRGAQGIVFLALKYCDNLGYDFPWILKRSGLPVLFLEADYRASASGQLLTRVQAFLETLPFAGRTGTPTPE